VRKNEKTFILIGALLVFGIIFLSGCVDKKSKFVGNWSFSEGGTVVFNNDGTAVITDIGPLADLALIGSVTYTLANQQITFSAGSVGVTLDYSFSDSNTLILTNNAGLSLILVKI
jgi:hypothetical protein